jgi:hypothetical protein
MTGPNSGPGHNSLLVLVEGQIDYAVAGITAILKKDLRYLDVRAEVQRRHNERLQKRLTKTTWMSGCSRWYLTADGFNASMYPGFATQCLRQMRDFRFGDYDAVARHAPASVVTAAQGAIQIQPVRSGLQHRPRARDAQRLGTGQEPWRHVGPGIRDRGQLGVGEARPYAAVSAVSATLAFSIESTIESVVTEILGEFIEKSADEQA